MDRDHKVKCRHMTKEIITDLAERSPPEQSSIKSVGKPHMERHAGSIRQTHGPGADGKATKVRQGAFTENAEGTKVAENQKGIPLLRDLRALRVLRDACGVNASTNLSARRKTGTIIARCERDGYRGKNPKTTEFCMTQTKSSLPCRTLLAVAAMTLMVAPAVAQTPAPSMSMPGMAAPTNGSASSQAFKNADEKMMRGMNVPMTGDTDQDFVAGMIPHHQGAVDMANVELQYGKDPVLRRLAQGIVIAQKKELAEMRAWQGKHPAAR
jgi:Domain of unknown function (DUF305)